MSIVTIFALISYWFTPEDRWFPKQRITNFIKDGGVTESELEPAQVQAGSSRVE